MTSRYKGPKEKIDARSHVIQFSCTPQATQHEVPKQLRPSEIQVTKVEILAIAQPPARIEALLHLPARFSCVQVPEVEPILIQDHDPLLETNTGLRGRRGWAGTSGHSLTGVRSQLRTFFFILGKSAKNPLPGSSARSSTPAGECWERTRKTSTRNRVNDLLHNPLRNAFSGRRRC